MSSTETQCSISYDLSSFSMAFSDNIGRPKKTRIVTRLAITKTVDVISFDFLLNTVTMDAEKTSNLAFFFALQVHRYFAI